MILTQNRRCDYRYFFNISLQWLRKINSGRTTDEVVRSGTRRGENEGTVQIRSLIAPEIDNRKIKDQGSILRCLSMVTRCARWISSGWESTSGLYSRLVFDFLYVIDFQWFCDHDLCQSITEIYLIFDLCQEPILFNDTIADNLRLGNPDISTEEMERVCRMANAHDFVSRLPKVWCGLANVALSKFDKATFPNLT